MYKPRKILSRGVSSTWYAANAARFSLNKVLNGRGKVLFPTYIINVCIFIEGNINEELIDFFRQKNGLEHKELVKPFLRMNFQDKLSAVVLFCSNFRFTIDYQSSLTKRLLRLIEIRNSLIHPKEYWYEATIIQIGRGTFRMTEEPKIPDNVLVDFEKKKITKKELRDYLYLAYRLAQDFGNLQAKFAHPKYKARPWFRPVYAT